MAVSLLKTFVVASSLSLVLVGCGGGDGGSDSATSSTTSSSSTMTTTVSSTSSTSTTTQLSGTLSIVDSSGVEGLDVKCGSNELTTSEYGTFECTSYPVSAYLGDFKIGEVKEATIDNTIYTQDLLNVTRGATAHSEVTKISMILQSLDEDAQPLNGVTLKEDTLSLLSAHLSSDTNIAKLSFEDVEYIIEDVIKTRLSQNADSKLKAVDAITAQSNLTTKTASAPALTYTQRSVGRI